MMIIFFKYFPFVDVFSVFIGDCLNAVCPSLRSSEEGAGAGQAVSDVGAVSIRSHLSWVSKASGPPSTLLWLSVSETVLFDKAYFIVISRDLG